ncbi:hypothetical protein [Methanolobus halotolerans]|nr:hypothetical protein [Methanolobus halotolerans]
MQNGTKEKDSPGSGSKLSDIYKNINVSEIMSVELSVSGKTTQSNNWI